AHILDGLLIALKDIDKVIDLIKKSKNAEIASQQLIANYKLSKEQTTAILDMRLQRLTGLEQEKIKEEYDSLLKLIIELKKIL
ncbi:MAG: DNA gyrase subunit A, partial [Candidatus Diapherotrites archaeon CG_4_10_14_0_2_um_filter_31_5]